MIPKIIHYCWFGKGNMSSLERKCFASWKKYCPDYEIKLWNEDNFDVNFCEFTQKAYQMGKYAFVSDVARIFALREYGGVYFDTDLMLIKPLPQEFIISSIFLGRESSSAINAAVMGGEKGYGFFQDCLEHYRNLISFNEQSIISKTIDCVLKNGHSFSKEIVIFDRKVFYPLPYKLRKFHYAQFLTDQTIGVHLWEGTWKKHNWSLWERIRYELSKIYVPERILNFEP